MIPLFHSSIFPAFGVALDSFTNVHKVINKLLTNNSLITLVIKSLKGGKSVLTEEQDVKNLLGVQAFHIRETRIDRAMCSLLRTLKYLYT